MGTTATISIQVDADVAQIYRAASSENKKKIQVLLSIWLREFGHSSKNLFVLMDEISDKAQERGLTSEILESLLDDE